MLTFEEFQATGRDVRDLREIEDFAGCEVPEECQPGRLYADDLYIEREPDGRWYLHINNVHWLGEPLADLEKHLYDCYLGG